MCDVSTYIQSGNVVFRTDRAEPGAVADRLSSAIHSSAELAVPVAGRDVHMYLPDGMGSSKLAAIIARRKPFEGTVRNWRTIGALLDMADAITS
ncbi:MAG: DUF1697 domain-containing protein [Acidimicrobiia bacterium]|nr:DUF1697 domain-containing protein [Acidimicrobiia bacterium]